MKNKPIPDKPLKTKDDLRAYYEELIFNALNWLRIDGYVFYVVFKGDDDWVDSAGAGASINVEFPYKKFKVSIQEDSVEKNLSQPLKNKGYWENVESGIFHECIHILVWRLAELAARRYTTPTDVTDAEEELTDHITHMFYPYVRDSRKKK